MISRFHSEKGLAGENDPLRAARTKTLSGVGIASPLRVPSPVKRDRGRGIEMIEMVDTRVTCCIAEHQLWESTRRTTF
jgi:hypothetical protein